MAKILSILAIIPLILAKIYFNRVTIAVQE